MILAIAAVLMIAQEPPRAEIGSWGVQTLEMIRRNYYIPESRLYADTYTPGKKSNQPAFNWGVGVMLSALNAAARYDSKYEPWLREYVEATRVYWNDKGPVPGYDVLPAPKPVDRYYDDNQWMILQLVEAHEILGNRRYLDWARETLRYVLSGEDTKLGGGIYWKETEKNGKNTCSNAPAAAACLAVYRHTKEPRLLSKAIQLYGWTKRTLQDPTDHLYWDNINLSGRIDRTKWSYNTALMMRTAADLHRLTGNPAYKRDLHAMSESSVRRWVGNGFKDEGRFAHLLIDAWLFAGSATFNPQNLAGPLRSVWHTSKNQAGIFGKRFDKGPDPADSSFELMDQAAAARAFFGVALSMNRSYQ